MAKNEGKVFEESIQKSCKIQNIKYLRLKDAPNQFSFGGGAQSNIRFTQSSPYDIEIYYYPNLICCELKSTQGTSFSIPADEKDNKKMIKARQIKGLNEYCNQKGVTCGFLFNFRENDNNTYFMSIKSFMDFYNNTTKKSINESDILFYSDTIKIDCEKKIKRYTYNLLGLFDKIERCD